MGLDWRRVCDQIHKYWMHKMDIQLHSQQERGFLALAFCGEAGELANLVKKEMRDGVSAHNTEAIKKEIADCHIYLRHIANSYQVSIEDVTEDKTFELMERWPEAVR